jgi:glutathione synthase/RimK-type ligase-like ATP-grasp enzyme
VYEETRRRSANRLSRWEEDEGRVEVGRRRDKRVTARRTKPSSGDHHGGVVDEHDPEATTTQVGITCQPDHAVFSTVASNLVSQGYAVTFFDCERPVARELLADLALFVSKKTRPASVETLLRAERLGVPTWNSATGVTACVSRFSQLCLLEGVGFAVPTASRTKPGGDYVAKRLSHWDMSPELNGEGDLYEEYLPAAKIDYKYYVVDDGEELHVRVLRATSKLFGEKRIVGEAEPIAEHVARIGDLMTRTGMHAVGVDLVLVDDDWYAVDLNPCPSFRGTGLEDALTASMLTCLR